MLRQRSHYILDKPRRAQDQIKLRPANPYQAGPGLIKLLGFKHAEPGALYYKWDGACTSWVMTGRCNLAWNGLICSFLLSPTQQTVCAKRQKFFAHCKWGRPSKVQSFSHKGKEHWKNRLQGWLADIIYNSKRMGTRLWSCSHPCIVWQISDLTRTSMHWHMQCLSTH